MTTYKPKSSDYILADVEGKKRKLLSTQACESFNTSLLGVGDLNQSATSTDAIAAVFDLEGFTNFCKQIEPHLSVPLFLSEFLSWLMEQIKKEMINKELQAGALLWCPLPFFVKFMGDGMLVLWDSSEMTDVARRNVIVSLRYVCDRYTRDFLPKIQQKVVEPPGILRCGIARGTVYSVGNGNDFVGSCINMAARIQKLPGATFAFNRRGFDLESSNVAKFFKEKIIVRRVSIRGIGENELIAILKSEFDSMKAPDKKIYRDS
ncbi:MAG TPA: hypothetical protein VF708_18985 [Pyrinomonadaceae bacterium]|jgi:class 3 adenylate cyclase